MVIAIVDFLLLLVIPAQDDSAKKNGKQDGRGHEDEDDDQDRDP